MNESVDLLALAAEECAHYDDCTLDGSPVTLCRRSRGCCGAWSATSSRMPSATASRRSRVELRRDGGNAVLERDRCRRRHSRRRERERVFVPFHQLGGERKGTGLGLALVRQIARLHGGEAMAAPRPDAAELFRHHDTDPLNAISNSLSPGRKILLAPARQK